jgi:hypothetical protein
MTPPVPRPWQRQSDETAAAFNAFVAYLRLKGRRSVRAVAVPTGLSVPVLRRLSARHHWPARVQAFETRLAEAREAAVDAVIRSTTVVGQSQLEQLRLDVFLLARKVLAASDSWLRAATNPRRRYVPLGQLVRLIELSSKLGRLATGLPVGAGRAPACSEPLGYWTQPSVEEALEKIYGSKEPADAAILPPEPPVPSPPAATAPSPSLQPAASPSWPPPDEKRDLIPRPLVVGPHGLLCLQPIEPP